MTHIDVEDIALLEDEASQLRSENEYLKITVDALTLENTELRATVRAWEIDHGAPLTEEELAARPPITHMLVQSDRAASIHDR